ncbi:unannotated protein [freshwater metagenome]|uniref:Unannotated protein n=1 Tax=freshwater metagenome TaxID=449393 RepID=A0A6J6UYY9_9ZZZZ|nr:diguanylate cyclase [Actinomycetota bacterium]MSY80439.1 diguanylate cyclase [Actinomycetota bacterium]MTA64887.1 diguanylate cyclase [Actinomycetota bacterium]
MHVPEPSQSSGPLERSEVEYSLLRRAAFASMDAESILTAEFDTSGHVVDFRFVVTNLAAATVLRKPMVDLLDHLVSEVFPSSAAKIIEVWAGCLASGTALIEEIEIASDTEQPRWIRQQILPLGDAIAVTSHDITDRRRAEEELRRLAHQDPLTELPNRRAALDGICASLERHGHASPTTVLFVDLDRFKAINDTFGHAGGDDLLRQIAARLGSVLRGEDMVARFGGDEFVICLDGAASPVAVRSIVDKLIDALRVPFRLGESDVSISASIGVAESAKDWVGVVDTANLLVHQADIAAYEAKRQGRDQVAVFNEAIGLRVNRESMVLRELSSAIAQGNLEVHYQPQVDLKTLRPVGIEASVRWNHNEHGLLAESEFLSVAESAGLMVPLGRWTRREGMAAMKRMLALSPVMSASEFVMWFKLTEGELQDGLASWLSADAASVGLVPSSFGFEVDAHSAAGVLDTKSSVLSELRELGFRVVLAEVAANHASIRSVRATPADALKMECATVNKVDDPDTLTRSAVLGVLAVMGQLAETLGLKLMVGGIDRESQLLALQGSGFFAGSGDLVAQAVPEVRLVEVLEALQRASV